MTANANKKVSDYEDESSFLVKERSLIDGISDETRGVLASVSHLVSEFSGTAVGYDASFYNAMTMNFGENATSALTSTTNTIDTLSADRRTTDISRESAFEQQRQQYLKEKGEGEAKAKEVVEPSDEEETGEDDGEETIG